MVVLGSVRGLIRSGLLVWIFVVSVGFGCVRLLGFVPYLGECGACGFDAELFLFGCELSAGHACPDSVHVGWGEL